MNYLKRKRSFRLLIKKIEPLLQILYKFYSQRTNTYRYLDIQVSVPPGVFNPRFSFSTKFFLKFLSSEKLKDNHLLEIGSGSGIISVFGAKRGAIVTTVDVNPKALACTEYNAQLNGLELKVLESDVFKSIPVMVYDTIVVNPPYYPKAPQNNKEMAWFCGANFEFFHNFFSQLKEYVNNNSRILMVLSEDCEINQIKEIAHVNNFLMTIELQKQIYWEINYIFLIKQINAN